LKEGSDAMSNRGRYDLQFKNLVDALSRPIIDATDEEIQEDASLADVDLDANAVQLKQMFSDTAKSLLSEGVLNRPPEKYESRRSGR
jgi:hypothetical protein